MDKVEPALRLYLQGLADAVAWQKPVALVAQSAKIRQTTIKCIVLNGLIFLGFLYIFNYYMKSFLHSIMSLLVSNMSEEQAEIHSIVADYVFHFTYYVLWVYPIYCISFILNSIWYQEIADNAYRLLRKERPGRNLRSNTSLSRVISVRIADELFTIFLELFMAIQVILVYFIPIVGTFISFFLMSWLYALYCFEYKWINFGWTVDRRLDFIERNWPYFAGFGLPFTCCTFFFPQFVNGGVFAMLFPPFIIMATGTDLEKTAGTSPSALTPERLPIFSIARYLNTTLVKCAPYALRRLSAPSAQQQQQEKS